MKICYLAPASSVHTQKWCEFFIGKGYEVHVISFISGEIPGVQVHQIDMKGLESQSSLKKLLYLTKWREVRRLIQTIQPDLIHAHYATSYGAVGALANCKPYIVSLWGSDVYAFPKKSILHRKLLSWVLSKSDGIASTSEDMKREALLYTDKEIVVTPFGIDTSRFSYVSREVEKPVKTFGIVKYLEKPYGIEILIQAFHKLLQNTDHSVRLLIGGDGSLRSSLEELCKDLGISKQVTFLGKLEGNQVVEAFHQMDFAVFPSYQESFGVAAIEAQGTGLPVIVTKVGGFPEVVVHHKTGFLVEPGNVEEVYEKMKYLLENPEVAQQMGKEGSAFVKEKYDVIENFNKIDQWYHEIVKIQRDGRKRSE